MTDVYINLLSGVSTLAQPPFTVLRGVLIVHNIISFIYMQVTSCNRRTRLPATAVFILFSIQCIYTGIYILIVWRARKLLVG